MTAPTSPQPSETSSSRCSSTPKRTLRIPLLAIATFGLLLTSPAFASPPAASTGTGIATTTATTTSTGAIPRTIIGKKRIPKKPYKTWSLFLVCNPEWLSSERDRDLYGLYKQFQSFGRAIGKDHLAVWFWKSKPRRLDRDLADNIDVERSVDFCEAFNLAPSEGPHLLVVSTYPDATNASGDYAHYALGAMEPKEISKLLAKLTDQLLLTGKVAKQPLSQGTAAIQPPLQDPLWVRVLEATRQGMVNSGCAWTFELNVGGVKTGLRPCQTTP